jgi:hypothetical protein
MTKLVKITGNYKQVMIKLGLPGDFYTPYTDRNALEHQIDVDLPRTNYVLFDHSVEEMQARQRGLMDASSSYTQGDFVGSVFTEIYLSKVRTEDYIQAKMHQGASTLDMAYIDDDGINCGFSIVQIRDDSDDSVPVERRGYKFVMAIIRNTTGRVEDREVTFIGDESWVPFKSFHAEGDVEVSEMDQGTLPAELSTLIRSAKINRLLEGLFDSSGLSGERLREIKGRTYTSQNIDKRRLKQPLLTELLNVAKRHATSSNTFLDGYLKEVEKRAKDDIDFFKEGNFEHFLRDFFKTVEEQFRFIPDNAQKNRALYELQLSQFILSIELKLLPKLEDRHPLRTAYSQLVGELRVKLDSPESIVEELDESALHKKAELIAQEIFYKNNLEKLEETLIDLEKRASTTEEHVFYQHGTRVVSAIKAIIGEDPKALGLEQLTLINDLLAKSSTLLTRLSVESVDDLRSRIVDAPTSPEWQTLREEVRHLVNVDLTRLSLLKNYGEKLQSFEAALERLQGADKSPAEKDCYDCGMSLVKSIKDLMSKANKLKIVDLKLINDLLEKSSDILSNLSERSDGKVLTEGFPSLPSNNPLFRWGTLREVVTSFAATDFKRLALFKSYRRNLQMFEETLAKSEEL